jgi:diguanylate cyclase (GGDEF)-like protein/PAS domain S-box-containing protein
LHGTFQDITSQKLAQAEIAETSSKLKATLSALPDLLFEVSEDGRIHQYHSHRNDLLAAPPEAFLGRRFDEILPADASSICRAAIDEARRNGSSSGQRYCLDLSQGQRWFELSVAPMEAQGLPSDRFIFISRDVTDRYNAEKQLELAGLVFDHAREGIMVADASGALIDVNDAFSRITGYAKDEVLGKNPRMLSSGRQSKEFYEAMWAKLREVGFWTGEVWNRRKSGEIYAELLTVSAVRSPTGEINRFVALFSDITAIKNYQNELEHIAHFDVLTGLPNRLLLADRLQQAMVQSVRHQQKVLIAYMDLDNFKHINDAHGHSVGDHLLVALSQRLQALLRASDTLARLGGDEFVVILTDFDLVDAVLPLITRLIAATSEVFHIDGLELNVSASVGITVFPQEAAMDPEQLLRQADQAMYHAKVAGKNRYHVFDTQHDNAVRSHFDVLERLHLALAHDEFLLYYQPKVNMRTGLVFGAEALIRWQHPERGLLAPGEFLGYLEGHQLSVNIGEWVIETALQQHETWLSAGMHIPVSVNIGALQLQMPDFAARLREILLRHPRVDPKNLQLEILETSALQDMQLAVATINACKALGVDFALDDFGTGYSSLTYLRELPVAVLKIDQSFVRNVLENAEDQAILRGVISLAAAFGREVIAEGVETEAHGTLLLKLGCDAAQGFGIARPMHGQVFGQWLQNWRPNPDWHTVCTS